MARPEGPGSHPSGHAACSVDGATRFDPSREIKRLNECLRYLASCQAATLENLPSRTSAYQRNRHLGIAADALSYLEGGRPSRAGDHDWVVNRLRRALCDSGSDPTGGDAVAAPGETSQSGGAIDAASPNLPQGTPQ